MEQSSLVDIWLSFQYTKLFVLGIFIEKYSQLVSLSEKKLEKRLEQ